MKNFELDYNIDKIKIIFCYIADKADYNPGYRPIAFGYIKSSLDNKLQDKFSIKYHEITLPPNEKADILLLSSLSPDWGKALEVIKEFRKNNPNSCIIVGGQHISQLPKLLPKEADFGLMGEGETSLPSLIDCIINNVTDVSKYKQIEGLVFFDEKEKEFSITASRRLSFDEIPQPDWLAEEGIKKIPYLLTSRGCPYNCTFCSSSHLWKKVSFQSAESIVEDIEFLSKHFPASTTLGILDDLFVADTNRLRLIYELLKQKNLLNRFKYSCNVRADLVTEELCELMKKLNIKYCSYGFESGVDRVLKLLKPNGRSSVETNINAANMLHKFGFKVYLSVVIGTPTETKEELLETYRLTMDLLEKGIVFDIAYNILTPMPGTYYWDMAIKEKLVEESNDFNWNKLSIFADFKYSNLENIDEWLQERKNRKSIYLNENFVPEAELLEIIHKYAIRRANISKALAK